jgi:3-deoxy-manno-octulosonate cytidylyltransferase (CMP-KDO synthetase)
MRVLGVIPARYGSSRFPGKPLLEIRGKTMIQRVFEGAKKSKLITDLIVATDDERIVEEVNRFGGRVMLTSDQHPSGTDRCAEILSHFKDVDVVINIQGDEPLVDPDQIDTLLSPFEGSGVQIATLGIDEVSIEDLQNPNRIKIVLDHADHAIYFSRSPIPNFENAKGDPLTNYPYLRHIGLYAYRSSVLKEITELAPTELEKTESLEQLRWLYYGYKIKVVRTHIETPNIDVPEDVEKVLRFL